MFIMNVDQASSFPSNKPLGGKTYGSGIVVDLARLIKDMARDVAWRAGRGVREAPCKKDVGMYGASQYFTLQWGKFGDKRLAHERVHKKDDRGQDNRVKVSQAGGAHPWPIHGLNYVSDCTARSGRWGTEGFVSIGAEQQPCGGASTENRLRAWRF